MLLENLHQRDEMTSSGRKGAWMRSSALTPSAASMFYSGASIGIAVAPDDSSDPTD